MLLHHRFFAHLTAISLVLLAATYGGTTFGQQESGHVPRVRTFRLDYGATLTGLPIGANVRVWLPLPTTNDHQEVRPLSGTLPAEPTITQDATYGNKILYFETTGPASREITFSAPFQVERREVHGLNQGHSKAELSAEERALFLTAHQKVPLTGKPTTLLEMLRLPSDPLELARVLYHRVDDHVRYDKSKPGYGNGDVLWVCDSRFGNCTDFHSLFISLARSQAMPARFEIGFPLSPERGRGSISGYHCWAFFFIDGRGWTPVDISEADKHPKMKDYYFGNLTENRVTFSVGRDITLVPKQDAGPLNFFVYPYVEVDGKPLPKAQIQLNVSYVDN